MPEIRKTWVSGTSTWLNAGAFPVSEKCGLSACRRIRETLLPPRRLGWLPMLRKGRTFPRVRRRPAAALVTLSSPAALITASCSEEAVERLGFANEASVFVRFVHCCARRMASVCATPGLVRKTRERRRVRQTESTASRIPRGEQARSTRPAQGAGEEASRSPLDKSNAASGIVLGGRPGRWGNRRRSTWDPLFLPDNTRAPPSAIVA